MKKINFNQMEKITANGDGQDLVSGVLCGLALGAAIPTGGGSLVLAAVGCGVLFGNW
ncbi:hypothetical protein NZD88_07505 [Chryseobacterium antibioticum]|uniref:Class IIb bacteriocin, lactobin A/cerein 7B family n=1 Tax=Chryseobacterium pyrolae TaxID=2987481 RepID=A0ABT2IFQ0_9FLAO|nr:hypothetical protein [Chryseobacterium pyrolae]MCT2407387.1 hypothetical protein [Chryseobacterium pyrolae]